MAELNKAPEQTKPTGPAPAVATYDLENKSKGIRVVHDANNQPVAIEVGQVRKGISLHDSTAKKLNETAEKNGLHAKKSGGGK